MASVEHAPDKAGVTTGPAAAPQRRGKAALADASGRDDDASRPGGFHESSYELQSGLQMTESEWPDDVTVPGALGSR